METLVVSHHRNQHQYYDRNRGHSTAPKFGSFGSPPPGNFHGINCRAAQSVLAAPSKSCSKIPIINRVSSSSFSQKTPSSVEDYPKKSKSTSKNNSIPIPIRILTESGNEYRSSCEQLHFSDLWAGPAYSHSPPPSSLPMPKFSMQPKRTVSLDLPTSVSEIDLHPIAKSAPTSPTRVQFPLSSNLFDISDSATKTLRRILNLDIVDE